MKTKNNLLGKKTINAHHCDDNKCDEFVTLINHMNIVVITVIAKPHKKIKKKSTSWSGTTSQ